MVSPVKSADLLYRRQYGINAVQRCHRNNPGQQISDATFYMDNAGNQSGQTTGSKASTNASQGLNPPVIKIAATAAPIGKVPSTDRSGKSMYGISNIYTQS